jgi:hypothetical protein
MLDAFRVKSQFRPSDRIIRSSRQRNLDGDSFSSAQKSVDTSEAFAGSPTYTGR